MITTAMAMKGMTTHRKLLAALLVGAALLSSGVRAQNEPSYAYQATGITVSGSGAAYGEPDKAVVTLGVDAVAETVGEALQQADATMTRVRQAALSSGVERRHIRTTGFNVWRQQLSDQSGQPTGERYHVQHGFQITVADPALVGQLLTAAIAAGANDVGGISFAIADTAALQSQARQAAMADARARAAQLAELAGVTLGPVVFVEETSHNAPQSVPSMQFARAASAAPIESGELAVSVTVKVVFAIGEAAN